MGNSFVVVTSIHWLAVILYICATLLNTYGLIFEKRGSENVSVYFAITGLFIHGIGILFWWNFVNHGPYIGRFEVLSSNAWLILLMYFVFKKFFPAIKNASLLVYPTTFLFVALALFSSPQVQKLPPSLRSIWLILHITFYKIALGTLVIGLAFSIFYILKNRGNISASDRFPDLEVLDLFAFRFAGFGFTFWTIGTLAGSIWAYQSWGRFWAWDPVETWSLITWMVFGLYLHLRRFFGWKGEKSAFLYIFCFILSLVAGFLVPLLESSVHSQYFR